jgi:hypothetical protein
MTYRQSWHAATCWSGFFRSSNTQYGGREGRLRRIKADQRVER